jgi:ATP-dependent helicase/nuclease subunit A
MSERPPYTPQQAAAIENRQVSIGLSAGAGCGKTFVLTERFLSHLGPQGESDRGGAEPLSQIVAITFTDRAAREMRDRIRSACARRIENCAETDVPHWLSILRSIDGARISTIHSFCAGFLRRHAVAAGVDPQFGLLEAETGDTLVRTSIARTVKRLLEQRDEDCLKLVVHYGLDGTRRMLGQLLSGHAMLDADRFLRRDAQQFASEWVEHLNGVFLPRLVRDFAASDAVTQILSLLRENESTNAVMCQRRALLLDRLESLRRGAPGVSLLEEIRDAAQVKGAGNKSTWPNEETYEAVKAGFERLRKEIDKIGEFTEIDAAAIQRSAELTVAAVHVVQAAAADLAAAKQEASLLGFDDLLVRTRNLLRQSEGVRRETAASIAALLVDEFQDTDPVQAEIVEALVGDGLANGKLFVVGDAKQSIYRFRRADPAVFDAMRARIPSTGRLPLTTNFRSQPAILNFVNALFAPVLKAAYEPLVPHREQVSPTPTIEFLFALPEADEDDPDRAEHRRRREAEWMARRIQELLDDPTPRIPEKDSATGETRLRRVQAGDFAVLFRALSDVALYEDVFRRRGIDYYLVGGRAFFAQQEVYDLVNLCAFLNDPENAIPLVGVLRSPFFSFSDDTLVALGGFGQPLRESLDVPPPSDLPESQQEQVRHASRVLGELSRKKDRLPLAGLLELAIERTGYDASLLHEFLGRRKVANLRKLIDMAREFDRSGRGTLSDFAQRLRDSISEETVEELAATHPETSNVVRLMTIHQSKGLEFPVVIVADMDRPSRGSVWEAVYHREFGPLLPPPPSGIEEPRHIAIQMNKYVEDREDEEESLRVLYVALTRAADHLILSSGLYSNGRPRSQWLKLLAERFDLGTGLPKGDPYFGTSLGKATPGAIPEIRVHHGPPRQTIVPHHKNKLAPLSRFREIVEQGESGSLPPLMRPVSSCRAVTPQFGVSAIEQADAFLRGSATAWPVLTDPLDADDLRGRDDPTVLGTVVHSVIDRLPWSLGAAKPQTTKRNRTAAGRDAEPIKAIVHAALRGLSPSDARKVSAEAVIQRVEAFVASELWTELTGAKRWFREIDFLLPWPVDSAHESEQAIISGQLDCLVQTADGGWKIVDYKTGRVPEGDPAALFEHFSIQLVLYAQAVRAMTGRLPDSIEIVALHEEIRRFPLTLWNEFLADVTHRIDAAVHLLDTGDSSSISAERPA